MNLRRDNRWGNWYRCVDWLRMMNCRLLSDDSITDAAIWFHMSSKVICWFVIVVVVMKLVARDGRLLLSIAAAHRLSDVHLAERIIIIKHSLHTVLSRTCTHVLLLHALKQAACCSLQIACSQRVRLFLRRSSLAWFFPELIMAIAWLNISNIMILWSWCLVDERRLTNCQDYRDESWWVQYRQNCISLIRFFPYSQSDGNLRLFFILFFDMMCAFVFLVTFLPPDISLNKL